MLFMGAKRRMMFSGDERSLLHHASDELTLDEVLGRLEASERVLGVLRIGSQGEPSPDSCSDLDLVIVLRGVDALPYRVGLTWIAGQLCDLLYVSEGQIDALLSNDDILDAGVWLGRIARWFAAGAVLLDSDGRLTQLSEALRSSERIAAPDPTQQGDLVWSIGYNLEQNKRMAHSEDALYRTALEMRLLYCVSDLMTAYFFATRTVLAGRKGGAAALAGVRCRLR